MSDAPKKLLKTLAPLALFVASQCSVANAAGTIQIVGPEGKDQTVSSQVVTQSQPMRATSSAPTVHERKAQTAATKMYGPTKEDETLWSIASRVNPSNTTSVQQTLIAIYRLNPQAFENNNIHGLEPNSRLRLPTLEQVRRENTDDAKQLLIAHKNKQNTQKSVSTKPVSSERKSTPAPKETALSPSKEKAAVVNQSPVKEASKTVAPASVTELKSELDVTEQEFSALQENNHQLRVRLAEVQNEVDNLKDSLGDEDRIRNEVEKFINEQKQLAVAEKKSEPSAMDNLASSPGLIALLALIPGALIAGLIAFFLFRRKKEEDDAENTPEVQPSALVMPEDNFNMDDDIPEISLDDDDLLGDLNDDEFLFGDDDSDSNEDLFAEFEMESSSLDNDDPFASLDDEENDDLDSMASNGALDLDLDDLDDDIDMSSSALTVDAEEKALGLEEMEKALNDFDSDLFSASDLEEEDDDFDLSLINDSDLSALDKSAPELDGNEDLEGGELDQSMLDDLFSSMDMEDDSEGSELDQGWDLDEKEETKLAPEPVSNSVEDELDFDALLSEMEETNKADEGSNKDDSIELDSEDVLFGGLDEESTELDIEDDSTALLDELLDDSDDEESIDLDIEDDSTALLDELLDDSDDEESIDLDIEDDSTALLDELLDDSDDEESIDLDIGEDSTALLDELLGDNEELSEEDNSIEIDEDSTLLLDELLEDKGEEEDTIELDEDSTLLLDELLGDDEDENSQGKHGDDIEAEGVAVSETLSEDTPRDEDWLVDADEDEDDDISLFESDTEKEDISVELDDLLEPEAELETEQDDVLSELEEPVELDTPSTDTTEQAQEPELELESETDDELDDLFAETEELDIENDAPLAEVEAGEEDEAEDDDLLFELDDLLESEAELETEQDDVLSELEEPVELDTPSTDTTEQAQEPELELELESETDDELDDLFAETEELDIENDAPLAEVEAGEEDEAEDDDLLFELDDLLESEAELETEQDDVLSELEEPVELDTPSTDATEQAQEPELESETDDELDDLFAETEELDVENDKPLAEVEAVEEDEAEEDEAEDDDLLFELDDLLEPEAELETEQDDVLSELEEPVELDTPSTDATEQAQEPELESESETDDELDDLFAETEELDVENDKPLVEIEDDENDFSLDDFLENSAVDFSQPSNDIQLSDSDSNFDGLSIEDALAALESEDELELEDKSEDGSESTAADFQSRVSDEEKEALTHLDSSGLDLDSMLDDGVSDWSGFNLDNASNTDAELEDEDWSEQPNVENDPHGEDRFLSIEALIAETENGDKSDVEEEDLNLDVGLDDFSDMLGNANSHDVDVNSDAQSKLDLARAYIEMSDDNGALELLEEVLRCNDPSLKVEAEKLMRQIN